MPKHIIAAIALASLCGGCVHSSKPTLLSKGASQVEVVESAAAANCAFVAVLSVESGANFRSYETNVDNATNDIRNQAARKGATHLVLGDPERLERLHGKWDGGGSGCNNCVGLTGKAYRCRASTP